ncbi:MAG: hypothetical protein IKV57_07365 [Clostridia bacterium]|nr:hypothetical protein [Clostridia bacterium]
MKTAAHLQDIYRNEDGSDILYTIEEGVYVRDVVIRAGLEEEICIGHLSDIHFNACNQQDFDEADPVVMSTYEHRHWLANGYTVPIAQRCFAFLDDADQIVLNGDTLDYLSHGCMELMDREVWEKYPGILATLGGHEVARRMEGKVPENTAREERLAILEAYWRHNIYYEAKLVKNKVLCIGLFNDQAYLYPIQKQKLEKDLALAREKGYIVLIFGHEPFATGNPAHTNYSQDQAILKGDPTGFPRDMCSGEKSGSRITGGVLCNDITKEVYQMIVNSADVVKGIFAGHYHNHLYFDVIGHTPAGEEVIIPQYVNTATAYNNGHIMRILVK